MSGDISAVEQTVARLDRWLDGMRGTEGYSGPVVHWWRDCLVFCGTGLDWRYEGVIAGYLALCERTGDARWLTKAQRAGDDLIRGQLPGGSFRNSSFELNPGSGGNPHEAAADVGLLLLVQALRAASASGWEAYLDCAERNLTRFHLDLLWSDHEGRFLDRGPHFVPNKAATIVEALCLLAQITGRHGDLVHYIARTAAAILAEQVDRRGHRLDGAIAQATIGRRRIEKYFPFYVARCIPGLEAASRLLDEPRYVEAALRAGAFLTRSQDPDGGFPQVLYENGRVNRFPRWVAGAGDVLRAFEVLRPYGFDSDSATLGWLLRGQLPTGAIRVAEGFGSQVSQQTPTNPADVRDFMPVVGWNDKAFRALASLVTSVDTEALTSPLQLQCTWGGSPVTYQEDSAGIEVTRDGSVRYRWRKGEPWALVSPRPRPASRSAA